MRIHHHNTSNDEDNAPQIVRQPDNSPRLQSPLQPQIMYDTTVFQQSTEPMNSILYNSNNSKTNVEPSPAITYKII